MTRFTSKLLIATILSASAHASFAGNTNGIVLHDATNTGVLQVRQVGANNEATGIAIGNGNKLNISQVGNANILRPAVVLPRMWGDVLIDGNTNTLTVKQSGDNNTAEVAQLGDDNRMGITSQGGDVKATQHGIANKLTTTITNTSTIDKSMVTTSQKGENNTTTVSAKGSKNAIFTEQGWGNKNTLSVTVDGDNNAIGDDTHSIGQQYETKNGVIKAIVKGSNNRVLTNQGHTDGDNIALSLTGNGNTAGIVQGIDVYQGSVTTNKSTVTLKGDDNHIDTMQGGHKNVVSAGMQGNSQYASVYQDGDSNTARLSLIGNNGLGTDPVSAQQFGNTNTMNLTRNGDNHSFSGHQTGNTNTMNLTTGSSTKPTRGNELFGIQEGDTNVASVSLNGDDDAAYTIQRGTNNRATATVQASGQKENVISQNGIGNRATINAGAGAGGEVTAAQFGNANSATLARTGNDHAIFGLQNGDNNKMSVTTGSAATPSEHSDISAYQYGDGNTLNAKFNGARNVGVLTQDEQVYGSDPVSTAPLNDKLSATVSGNDNVVGVSQVRGKNNSVNVTLTGNNNRVGNKYDTTIEEGVQQFNATNETVTLNAKGDNNLLYVKQRYSNGDSATATVTGNRNVVDIKQQGESTTILGNANKATVSIKGSDSWVTISQTGSNNVASSTFSDGSSQADVTQIGTKNTVQLSASGMYNSFMAKQTGSENTMTLSGKATTNETNYIRGEQRGDKNRMLLKAEGNGNLLSGYQQGTSNSMTVNTHGDHNTAMTTQTGNNNSMNITYYGSGNTGFFTQTGNGLKYTMSTTLSNQTFNINQKN